MKTELKSYFSQMSQDELSLAEQVIVESKVKKAICEITTKQQFNCIANRRKYTINIMDRNGGKSWGLLFHILYRMEDCTIIANELEVIHNLKQIIKLINEKTSNVSVYAEYNTLSVSNPSVAVIHIGNNIFKIEREHYARHNRDEGNPVYIDDNILSTTEVTFNSNAISYISEGDFEIYKPMNIFDDFCKKYDVLVQKHISDEKYVVNFTDRYLLKDVYKSYDILSIDMEDGNIVITKNIFGEKIIVPFTGFNNLVVSRILHEINHGWSDKVKLIYINTMGRLYSLLDYICDNNDTIYNKRIIIIPMDKGISYSTMKYMDERLENQYRNKYPRLSIDEESLEFKFEK